MQEEREKLGCCHKYINELVNPYIVSAKTLRVINMVIFLGVAGVYDAARFYVAAYLYNAMKLSPGCHSFTIGTSTVRTVVAWCPNKFPPVIVDRPDTSTLHRWKSVTLRFKA